MLWLTVSQFQLIQAHHYSHVQQLLWSHAHWLTWYSLPQNNRDLLRATAVTRGWTDTEIQVSTESWPWRRKFSRHSLNPVTFRSQAQRSNHWATPAPVCWEKIRKPELETRAGNQAFPHPSSSLKSHILNAPEIWSQSNSCLFSRWFPQKRPRACLPSFPVCT